jgi:hypothetical protein
MAFQPLLKYLQQPRELRIQARSSGFTRITGDLTRPSTNALQMKHDPSWIPLGALWETQVIDAKRIWV